MSAWPYAHHRRREVVVPRVGPVHRRELPERDRLRPVPRSRPGPQPRARRRRPCRRGREDATRATVKPPGPSSRPAPARSAPPAAAARHPSKSRSDARARPPCSLRRVRRFARSVRASAKRSGLVRGSLARSTSAFVASSSGAAANSRRSSRCATTSCGSSTSTASAGCAASGTCPPAGTRDALLVDVHDAGFERLAELDLGDHAACLRVELRHLPVLVAQHDAAQASRPAEEDRRRAPGEPTSNLPGFSIRSFRPAARAIPAPDVVAHRDTEVRRVPAPVLHRDARLARRRPRA